MKKLRVAVAQFEPKDSDKEHVLSVMEALTAQAKEQGAEVIRFHELAVTAYTFLKKLGHAELHDLVKEVPGRIGTQRLIRLAHKYVITILQAHSVRWLSL